MSKKTKVSDDHLSQYGQGVLKPVIIPGRYGGAYVVRYRAPGEKTYRSKVCGHDHGEAIAEAERIRIALADGTWVDPRQLKRKEREERSASQGWTWGDVHARFRVRYAQDRQPTSIINLDKAIQRFQLVLPDSTPLLNITPETMKKARDSFVGGLGANSTKNLYIMIMKTIFRWASKQAVFGMKTNPAAEVELIKASGIRGNGGVKAVGRDEITTRDEVLKMIGWAHENRPPLTAYMVQTAFATGLRKGELCGLLWAYVDFKARTIRVCRSYGRKGTKSGEERTVPMESDLVRALAEWKAKSDKSGDTDPVFPTDDGKVREMSMDWSATVKRIASGAGVSRAGLNVTGHMTRHFFASEWLRCGGSNVLLARVLGHKDTKLIDRVYSHFTSTDLVEAMDRIGFTLATNPATVSVLPSGKLPKVAAG
jgi:integrase